MVLLSLIKLNEWEINTKVVKQVSNALWLSHFRWLNLAGRVGNLAEIPPLTHVTILNFRERDNPSFQTASKPPNWKYLSLLFAVKTWSKPRELSPLIFPVEATSTELEFPQQTQQFVSKKKKKILTITMQVRVLAERISLFCATMPLRAGIDWSGIACLVGVSFESQNPPNELVYFEVCAWVHVDGEVSSISTSIFTDEILLYAAPRDIFPKVISWHSNLYRPMRCLKCYIWSGHPEIRTSCLIGTICFVPMQ